MSFTSLLALITLTPAVAGLIVAGLGFLRRPNAPAVWGIFAVGTLVPLIGLLMLLATLSPLGPQRTALVGQGTEGTAWLLPSYRVDAFGVGAGLLVVAVIVPLLAWLAWRGAVGVDARGLATRDAVDVHDDFAVASETTDDEAEDAHAMGPPHEPSSPWRALLDTPRWSALALVLGLESAALWLGLTDNVGWMALCWIALAALTWGLGEVGSSLTTLDRIGLALMVAGPLLWLVGMSVAEGQARNECAHATALLDLSGCGGVTSVTVLVLALAIALACGAYPFHVWLRRRTAFTAPVGVGALLTALIPLGLLVGVRTYGALADQSGLWPQLGTLTPPLTMGIAFVVLGAATVAFAGYIALTERESRALLALLATAQAGWGMIAIGISQTASAVAVVLLALSATLGLGAMLAATVAGGTLTGGEEADGAGPKPFGAPLGRANLFAWCIGGFSLVGLPPLAGFVALHVTSAATLEGARLSIPFVGLAWAGSALLALAFVRATAPAFALPKSALLAEGADAESDAAPTDDETDADAEEESPDEVVTGPSARPDWHIVPGVVLAVLVLLLGVLPQVALGHGVLDAATAVLNGVPAGAAVVPGTWGYTVGAAQWLPLLALGVAVVLGGLLSLGRLLEPRRVRPLLLAGGDTFDATDAIEDEQEDASAAPARADRAAVAATPDVADESGELVDASDDAYDADMPDEAELDGLEEPDEAYPEIAQGARSPVAQPGAEMLLPGLVDWLDRDIRVDDEHADEALADDEADATDGDLRDEDPHAEGDEGDASDEGDLDASPDAGTDARASDNGISPNSISPNGHRRTTRAARRRPNDAGERA